MSEIPQKLKEYIDSLEGINYFEWIKLQHIIERYFDNIRHEAEKGFRFVPNEIKDYPF